MTLSADHLRTTREEAVDPEWIERLLASAPKPSVYFISWEDGPVKIGHAADVRHRLHQLQSACPYELRIFATRQGGLDLEAFYHQRFSEYWLRGEWFERGYRLMQEIGKLNGSIRGKAARLPNYSRSGGQHD